MLFTSTRRSRRAGLLPQPQRTRRHHPDFDKMATQGWKALEAEGQLPATAWRKERQWALDMGLPGAESITDREIPTFARGELPHFAGINTFMKAPYIENVRDVGKYDAAVRQLSSTINAEEVSPSDAAQALYLRGIAYRKLGESARAIADLGAAMWLGLPGPDAVV